ncbi:MAG TPA: c-type cytochrome [Candidatus Angelobacter sp.]|nr:c-type cytochrome [Candidatus Angelobacter sp.]
MSFRNQIGWVRRTFFGDPARRFAWTSLILTISLAIAPTKEFFTDWRQYQRQFLKLIHGRSDSAAIESRFASGIQQIWIPEQNVVDRCGTCHLALKEESLRDVHMQPFRPHPTIPHSLTDFGCVVCHGGQGAATTVEDAHRGTKAWEQPILPARFLEASCGQCHLGTLEGTPKLNLGRQLLARYGCVRCHTVTQPDGTVVASTDDSPPLGHIAEKTSREWLFAWIKNPQAYAASATMPNFQFTDREAADVATFLIAQSTPSGGAQAQVSGEISSGKGSSTKSSSAESSAVKSSSDKSSSAKPGADAGQEGASVYGTAFCSSCHAVQNAAGNIVGGDLGPELTRIGSKVNPDWLHRWLKDPQAYDPRTQMPHYRFDEKQLAMLSGYLLNKKDDGLLANAQVPASESDSVARGKKLVAEYGCAACHQINGVNRPQNFAPDLSGVGSKPLAQISFGPGSPETLPDYISGKIHDPRAAGAGLKMPKYALTNSQIEALTIALLAQTDRAANLPKALILSAAHPSDYQPGGDAGRLMNELRCQSCHSINGHGGDMAPDLSWEGSAVQRPWLEEFMRNPNTLRPALIRRMPKFNLSPAEIKTISDYMLSAYEAPGFDSGALDTHALNADAAARGKELFYSKYGCQSCHIADYKKDKGYIGPPLAGAGNRRPAVWIYRYLKNPQAVVAGTQMPNANLSEDEARDLTAFLMTLKAKENGGAK